MAFTQGQLERVGGGLKKLFIYNAGADTVATVTGSGYFSAQADMLDAGDVIIVLGNNLTTIDLVFVTSARGVVPVTTLGTEGITAT